MAARRSVSRPSLPSPAAQEAAPQVQVPKTNKDPVLSLCPWSIDVSLGRCQDQECLEEHSFEIPAAPASEWLQYLLSSESDLNQLITGMMPKLEDFYFENYLPVEDMYKRALEIIEIASARSWWIALRLISAAAANWNILGPKMLMSGVDASRVSLAAWLDVLLLVIIENSEPKNVMMFTLKLEAPPPNIFGAEQPEEMETDRSAFLAFGAD